MPSTPCPVAEDCGSPPFPAASRRHSSRTSCEHTRPDFQSRRTPGVCKPRQHVVWSHPHGNSVSRADSKSSVQTCQFPYFLLVSCIGDSSSYFLCLTGIALFFLICKGRCNPGPRGTE